MNKEEQNKNNLSNRLQNIAKIIESKKGFDVNNSNSNFNNKNLIHCNNS